MLLAQDIKGDLSYLAAKQSARKRGAHFLDRAIFGSLLALIVLVAVPYGTVEAWWVAAYECLVFVLAALWIIESQLGRTWNPGDGGVLCPLVLVVLFSFLQTLPLVKASGVTPSETVQWLPISADPFETRLFTLRLLTLLLNGFLLIRYTSNRKRLRSLIHVVIAVSVASALFGLVRQTQQGEGMGFLLPYLKQNSGYAQFINKNHFALLMEMALGLLLGLMFFGGVGREQILIYLSATAVVGIALALSYSRGGVFGMLGQLLFLGTLYSLARPGRNSSEPKGDSQRFWLIGKGGGIPLRVSLVTCLLLVIMGSVVWMGGDLLATRMGSLSSEVNGVSSVGLRSGTSRLEVWQSTWRLIKSHPMVGSGFGAYEVAITGHHNSSGEWTPEAAHNDYLELLAGGGVMGLALVAWFVIALIKRARDRIRSADAFGRGAAFGALAGLVGVGIHSAVDFGLHTTANSLVFTALAVVATASIPIRGCQTESRGIAR